jgi:DNA-binding response OmpR family regulator
VDEATKSVWVAGRQIALTPSQLQLARLFADNPGTVLSRDEILLALYPDEFREGVVPDVQDSRVDTVVKRLRERVEPQDGPPVYILTVRGHGYKLRDPAHPD